MKFPVYLDYSATTPIDPRVVEAMLPYLTEKFGNPASRSHQYGWDAEAAVENARAEVAALVNADPGKPITVSPTGLNAKGATGEVLTADKVNAYNTFAAPGVVAPKPYSAKAKGGTLSLTLAPKSLTVVRLER